MLGNNIGNNIIELSETDSTNSFASRLLHNEIPEEGTVIMAHYQKAGRGQRSSGWESEKDKNLLASYILYPTFLPIGDQFLLNQVITLGVFDFIKSNTNEAVFIKWPNDIIINNLKIAGILIENSIRSFKIIHSICGIGININQESFNEFSHHATSLILLEKKFFDLRKSLSQLNSFIDKWYTALCLNQYVRIRKTYSDALFLAGTSSIFESNGVQFTGTIEGVMNDGRLKIIKADESVEMYNNKEVKFIF